MQYVFFGSSSFAAAILNYLISNGYTPAAVITNPDRPVGRKQIITPPPVKALIMEHETWNTNIKTLQPEKLDESVLVQIRYLKPDFGILADYGKIIPPALLKLSRLGIIGVHVSLLPKYRGASPMQTAILNGEPETGVTLYLMDEKIDTGPILAQEKIKLVGQNFLELRDEAAAVSCALLKETLPEFTLGRLTLQPQKHEQATYTKKFITQDAFVDAEDLVLAENGENKTAAETIECKIRALNPEPGVWTMKDGKRMKLLKAAVQNGRLVLEVIQVEGEITKQPTS